jgi:hypothetical protein
MKRSFTLFAFIFALLSLSQSASAQFQYNYSSNIWLNSDLNQMFQKRWTIARTRAEGRTQLADAMDGRRSINSNGNASTAQSAPAENILRRVPLSQTSFKSNPIPVMPSLLGAKFVDQKPQDLQTLVKTFSELLKNYDAMLVSSKQSYLRNNVAGAATFALLMSRSVLTGQPELSDQQSDAVLQDINALLASSDKFKALPAIAKQKIYETFIITAGLAAMLNDEGKQNSNAETVAQGKDLAKTILSLFFDRPLSEIQFTDDGVTFGV